MLEQFLYCQKLQELHQALEKGSSVLVEELWDSPKALIAAMAQAATGKNVLILSGKGQEESKLYHDLHEFTERPIVDFPAWETLPNEKAPPSPDIVGERYQVLSAILKRSEPQIILSSLQACLQRLIVPKMFNALYFSLKRKETFGFETLIDKLNEMGYRRCPVTADKAEFSVRGGIIDIYPVSSSVPFRIEFWGDEIESIRSFDPIGQKSKEVQESIEITPAQEMELIGKEKNLATILDYLGPNTLVIFDDLVKLEDRFASLINILGKPIKTFLDLPSFLKQLDPLQKIFCAELPIEELSEIQRKERIKGSYYSNEAPLIQIGFHLFNRPFSALRWKSPFTPVIDYLFPEQESVQTLSKEEILLSLSKLSGKEYTLKILCPAESDQTYFQKTILELNVSLPDKTDYKLGYLSSGFVLHDIKLALFPTTEITHRFKMRRQKLRSTFHTAPSEVYDLKPGEVVVHLNNGLGKYLGLEKRPNNLGVESEFFLIEYAGNAKLFVPINQAHLVSKYIGANEEIPKLHTLGSSKWKRTKENTERAIMGYASELLQVYAKRELKKGFQFPPDSPDTLSFEESFSFVETEDQLQAIANIKSDMCAPKAMDRLVCGDVGYGKTEVAIRAAFKAVVDGAKQVAVLVPTTVLAMQHYENFVERMQNFPINISVLSRFRTSKQIKQTLEGTEKGSVDIVIGTLRLISKDVCFKNLGLVIIDEEQRFGVRAKEHLKKIKENVDCLTLSATPIPRTLYMSLIGARDLSVINTPPQDRVPIKTMIAEPDDQTIKQALLRELARDGQAYFIHNRVESILSIADKIKTLLPQAKVAVANGQMHSEEIDEVFHAFKNGHVDILVATTIVESGVDIPNANTILIDRADRFGLADLYQLRGRVGRWNRRAYAYFLIPRFRSLPEISKKRLSALAEASGYGGGMKLAMRDLEIRGAGDILGTEQSGHAAAIGFHLYCKLLKRTIKTLEGKMPSIVAETKIEIPVDARLPEDYVNEASLRMEIYQRLGDAVALDDIEEIYKELLDRFGKAPEQVRWLYHLARVRVFASLRGYTLLKVQKISLHSEQKKGKKLIARQQLIGKISSPAQMEEKILALLSLH